MFKKEIRLPIISLFLIALGGLLLHLRIHPPSKDPDNYAPLFLGIISVFILPFMFNCQKTAVAAYFLNLIAIITGTFAMAFFSINNWNDPVTVKTILLQSTLADILILFARLPLAHIILKYWQSVQPAPQP